jgi:hypothetical protein
MSLIAALAEIAGISLGIHDMTWSFPKSPLILTLTLTPDHAKALKAFLGMAPSS